jgi:hypothetical protein
MRVSTAERAAHYAKLLRPEQVRLLYASSGMALVTTPVAAVTLTLVSWGRVPPGLAIAWLSYVLSVAVARALLVRRFQQLTSDAVDVPAWCRRFVTGAMAAGLGWGAAGGLFFSAASVPWQMFLALVLAGVTMAAVPVLAPVLAAFCAFTIPTLLPITVRFLPHGPPIGLGMAAFGVLFGTGSRLQRPAPAPGAVWALVLAFENRDLVAAVLSRCRAPARRGQRAGCARRAGTAGARAHGGATPAAGGAAASRRDVARNECEPARADRGVAAGDH